MNGIGKIEKLCAALGCEYRLNESLREHTSFKIGGPADIMVFPESTQMLSQIIVASRSLSLPVFPLGNGSNLLVSDSGIRGVVISSERFNNVSLIDETTIVCGSGVKLSKLCNFALSHSLSGLEFAYGIPGTTGGAVYMNAGAYGGEMKDVLVGCTHVDSDGKVGEIAACDLELGYRTSVYEKGGRFITEIKLQLVKADAADIKAKMTELIGKRQDKQPLEFPSAGSTFKRPEGYFAGALIEQCGLKGFTVGGAQVSEKHAGFVINRGGATAADVMSLIESVQKTVFENTGVHLEPEVKFIG